MVQQYGPEIVHRFLYTSAVMQITSVWRQVDGMGNSLLNFDDPNVPSLLSIPLLGYAHYVPEIYAATRARILSRANDWYFEGSALRGLGSPHTPHSHVWPLAMSVQVCSLAKPTVLCTPGQRSETNRRWYHVSRTLGIRWFLLSLRWLLLVTRVSERCLPGAGADNRRCRGAGSAAAAAPVHTVRHGAHA